jgi:predicted phosphoribosyltransferase
MLLQDRTEAGRLLAERLSDYAGRPDVIVLALPRGGLPVGFEVARRLGAPLDVFVVRKLGVPGHEELAMGAIASGDVVVVHPDLVNALGIAQEEIDAVIASQRRELARREAAYRDGEPPPSITGRTVILVDDGIATGATMQAGIAALRKLDPARIVVGVPVAPPETCDELAAHVDELVCLETPEPFRAVSLWYDHFDQVSDEEVRALLRAARHPEAPAELR